MTSESFQTHLRDLYVELYLKVGQIITMKWKAYCILRKMRKLRKLRIGCVNAQYMRKICTRFSHIAQDCARLYFFPRCAIYAQDLRKIVLLSPMRKICTRLYLFPNVQYMCKICTRLYLFLQCAIYAQYMCKICARLYLFPQCTIYAQDLCKIILNF